MCVYTVRRRLSTHLQEFPVHTMSREGGLLFLWLLVIGLFHETSSAAKTLTSWMVVGCETLRGWQVIVFCQFDQTATFVCRHTTIPSILRRHTNFSLQ
jgi:Na+/pantothenate symporter